MCWCVILLKRLDKNQAMDKRIIPTHVTDTFDETKTFDAHNLGIKNIRCLTQKKEPRLQGQ